MSDLTVQTPLEIDTQIAALYDRLYAMFPAQQSAHDSVMYAAGAKRTYGRGRGGWTMTFEEALEACRAMAEGGVETRAYEASQAGNAVQRYQTLRDQATALREEISGLDAEWRRRGRWTRAYLVTDGHVHKSMDCSTCNNGEYRTQFTWLVDFADKTEAEVIEAAADRACTVCYPNAPVVAEGTSTLMTPEEKTRAEQREEAARAKAERSRQKIAKGLTEDGSEFVVSYPETGRHSQYNQDTGLHELVAGTRTRTERFKTEQAAVAWLVRYTIWDEGRTSEKAPAFQAIKEAVADKHGMTMAEVEAMIEKKIAAKRKRDERGY